MFRQQVTHGNILSFTPPGMRQTLNVKFPDSRLAVCEKCKRNYKTRDMCRVRNSHTSAPWTTAFICITLDETCFALDGETYTDKPLSVRLVPWQPYTVKKPFGSKTPVCSSCKKTNRTRSFCRNRHQHKALPWCTVYVVLSAVENGTIINSVTPVKGKTNKKSSTKSSSSSDKNEVTNAVANNIKRKVEKIAKAITESEVKVLHEEIAIKKGTLDSDNLEKTDDKQVKEKLIKEEQEFNTKSDEEKSKPSKDVGSKKIEDNQKDESSPEKKDKKEKKEGVNDDDDDEEEGNEEKELGEEGKEGEENKTPKDKATSKKSVDEDEEFEVGDDINDIAASRTFLAKVSCRNVSIHWLNAAEMGPENAAIAQLTQSVPDVSVYDPSKILTGQPTPAGFDATQYYTQMTAMGYPPHISQQHAMQMQHQQFLQMQQRQQFVAQHAAWQQYNQQMMNMNGQMMAHHGMAIMPHIPTQAMSPVTPETQTNTTDEIKKEDGASESPDPVVTAGAAAFQAQAQAQAQAHWQAQMMYQQHMYHQQFQMQQMAAAQQQQMMAAQPGMYFPGQAVTAAAQANSNSTKKSPSKKDKENSPEEVPAKKVKLTEI